MLVRTHELGHRWAPEAVLPAGTWERDGQVGELLGPFVHSIGIDGSHAGCLTP